MYRLKWFQSEIILPILIWSTCFISTLDAYHKNKNNDMNDESDGMNRMDPQYGVNNMGRMRRMIMPYVPGFGMMHSPFGVNGMNPYGNGVFGANGGGFGQNGGGVGQPGGGIRQNGFGLPGGGLGPAGGGYGPNGGGFGPNANSLNNNGYGFNGGGFGANGGGFGASGGGFGPNSGGFGQGGMGYQNGQQNQSPYLNGNKNNRGNNRHVSGTHGNHPNQQNAYANPQFNAGAPPNQFQEQNPQDMPVLNQRRSMAQHKSKKND